MARPRKPRKQEEQRTFRVKLRPKLTLQIDCVADDHADNGEAGERDKVAGKCAASNPASLPKNDPAKIPTRITDHRTGEVTDYSQPQKLALTPEQLTASNASLAAIRDGVRKASAGEKLEVTSEAEEQYTPSVRVENCSATEASIEYAAQPEPTLTQAEIQALTQPKADDESWFEAIDAVCEKIGVYGACRWFLGAVGAGAGGATVVWAVSKMLSK